MKEDVADEVGRITGVNYIGVRDGDEPFVWQVGGANLSRRSVPNSIEESQELPMSRLFRVTAMMRISIMTH